MLLPPVSFSSPNTVPLEECQSEIFRLYGEEDMKPVLHQVLPISRLPEAFDQIQQRKSIGKIVVVPE